jgi:hypothetical protein
VAERESQHILIHFPEGAIHYFKNLTPLYFFRRDLRFRVCEFNRE